MKSESNWNKRKYYSLSILIPVFLLLFIFILFSMTPFGNRTWLTVDLGQQYVDFFAYYQDTLLHHPEQFFLQLFQIHWWRNGKLMVLLFIKSF